VLTLKYWGIIHEATGRELMKKKKVVTIIITNYNRGKFIDRAIRSCLEQIIFSKLDIELIVVDDGSTDESLNILEMFETEIILIAHEKNKGVAAAANSGLRAATGDYITRLDADDFFNKLNIFVLSQILDENPGIGFVYTDHIRVDERGYKQEKVCLDSEEQLYEHGAGVMFRREIFDNVGMYDEGLTNCEDYDLLARVRRQYKGFYLPLPLYRYHIHGENISLKKDRDSFKSLVRSRYEL